MTQDTLGMRRWTRREYDQLIDRGVFRPDERVELLDGLLVVKEPQGTPHTTAIDLAVEARAAMRDLNHEHRASRVLVQIVPRRAGHDVNVWLGLRQATGRHRRLSPHEPAGSERAAERLDREVDRGSVRRALGLLDDEETVE